MIQNALAATLAGFVWGFKVEDIRASLETFIPSPAHTPGRMNMFHFKDYKILVDHAHNPDGLRGVRDFLKTMEADHFTGVISGTGDRRDDDIREMGRISATMFDEVIICQEKYLRDRSYEEMINLLVEGLLEVNPGINYKAIPNSKEALTYLLKSARTGSFITIISDSIKDSVKTIQKLQDEEAGIKIY